MQTHKSVALSFRFHCPLSLSPSLVQIEVETSSMAAACEAVEAGADIVMLDNMRPADLHDVARQLKVAMLSSFIPQHTYPYVFWADCSTADLQERYGQHKFLIEASGGITSQTIKEFFGPHVDVISM
jgi:nicotinate-nucleotide pyrophosphorylase (carboxylating)